MDKSKWEYKKLGDLCTKLTDGSHNPPKGIDDSDYRMISSQNIFNDRIELSDYRCLSKEDFEVENKRTTLKRGDLLLTIVGAIGRCYVLNGSEGNLTLQRSVAALTPKDNVISRYLMYYFIGNNAKLIEEAHGVAQKGIYLKQLRNFIVPVPTLSDQQRIVAELDCLNEMIAVKQEQLKEFDKLAQSIFYDMFGDPITNEKGWRVDVLNSVCDVRDGTHDSPKYVEDGYPLITSKNVVEGGISFDDVNYISEDDLNAINARSRVDDGDIIMPMIGTIGKPVIVHKDREFAIKNVALIKFEMSKVVLNIFIQSLLNSSTYSNYILSLNRGGTQKFVSLKTIRNLPIILPPLALQKQFAEKIQAIEAQKELVKKSIAETQQLLDSRMDYYFD